MSKVNWWKPKHFSLLLLAGLALAGCKKDPPEEVDLGYDYFPNRVGTYFEYEVDSTDYDAGVETPFHFYVREEFSETYIDGEGQLAMRVERYVRQNPGDTWLLEGTYAQKRTATTAERIEGNRRFVHLVFPINSERTWDGNAYNDLATWNYTYANIGAPYILNASFQFEDAVKVNQRQVFNLIDQEEAWVIFAKDIGLVHRRFKDLSYAFGNLDGVDVEYILTDYGDL